MMRNSWSFIWSLCLVLGLVIGCTGTADECGANEVRQGGQCIEIDASDASDASDPTDASDSSDASRTQAMPQIRVTRLIPAMLQMRVMLPDASDASDATDPSDATDASDASDPSDGDCIEEVVVETPLPDDASVQDITLKLGCWDEATGIPATASYTDQYNEYNYLELTNLRMEPVDAGNEWAAYKLIGTIAEDGSHRIFFFTDPTGDSGQLQLLVLSPDYSQTWFDSGIRSWGDAVDPTDASDARPRPIG